MLEFGQQPVPGPRGPLIGFFVYCEGHVCLLAVGLFFN